MNSTEIIAILGLCLSVPSFILCIASIIYYLTKNKLKIIINYLGIDPITTQSYFMCEFLNFYKDPITIYKITMNDNNMYIYKKNQLYEFKTVELSPYKSTTIALEPSYLLFYEKLTFKFYSTRAKRPYKLKFKSFVDLCKKVKDK